MSTLLELKDGCDGRALPSPELTIPPSSPFVGRPHLSTAALDDTDIQILKTYVRLTITQPRGRICWTMSVVELGWMSSPPPRRHHHVELTNIAPFSLHARSFWRRSLSSCGSRLSRAKDLMLVSSRRLRARSRTSRRGSTTRSASRKATPDSQHPTSGTSTPTRSVTLSSRPGRARAPSEPLGWHMIRPG